MRRIATFCLTHTRWVFVAWLLLTVAGAVATAGLSSRLNDSFTLPGQSGYEANQAIIKTFGGGGYRDPALVVVSVPAGDDVTSTNSVAALARGDEALARSLAVDGRRAPRIVSYASTADPVLVSADHRATFVLVYPPTSGGLIDNHPLGSAAAAAFSRAAQLPRGSTVGVTGFGELSGSGGGGSGVLTETMIGALGAIVILAFVFGSFIALVPLVTALVSILTTFLLVDGLTLAVDVSFLVQFLVALIGLGVAIDYSLLVVTRWREERAHGRDNRDAVEIAMHTAGRSVLYSGVTVAIGLFALVVLPVPFLRSVGYGGVLIPLVSVLVSITLLPALLATAGPFLDRPRRRRSAAASRAWSSWGRLVVRRRWTAVLIGGAVLVALLIPAFSLVTGEPTSSALASSGAPRAAANRLEQAGVNSGALTPIQVLTSTDKVDRVIAATRSLPGVRGALQTGASGEQAVIDVIPERETNSGAGADVIGAVRRATENLGTRIGGSGAQSQSFNHAVYDTFALMLTLILLVSFVLLMRTFRSVLMALKAVLLNLLSVGATYGVLVLVWQHGHGSQAIWNTPATGAITNFIPLMVFAFLFGLSMDYEVFILSRIREEHDAGADTPDAIVEGLGRTGRLVTSAALILAFSFFALSQAPDTDLKVFATGLGAGILLDATIVRALMVPALLTLFGRYNWWLPTSLARALRVRPPPRNRTPTDGCTTPAGRPALTCPPRTEYLS
jgi:putative drug exporter of the RND superfamily